MLALAELAPVPAYLAAVRQPKVYSYARFSTPEQAQGDSFRRQTEAAREWARRRGLVLDERLSFADEGVSAYRGDNALDGGFSRFLEACRRGLVEPGSFLLVESLDRLSRMSPLYAQLQFAEIVKAGVTIVTLADNQEYSEDRLDREPWALMIALMVAMRAHEESKTKGRRVAAAWAEKRRRVRENPSERLTRRAPAWLLPRPDGGWMEDSEKANIVRRIFALTLAGEGENKIAAILNSEGVPVFGRAKHWHRSTVAKVLRNPAVIGSLIPGRMEHQNGRKVRILEEPVHNAFPAVVSEADWLAVRALKHGKAGALRGRHAGTGVAHLLAGLAECPRCGSRMTRVYKGRAEKAGSPKLVCTRAKTRAGCRYVSVPVTVVEQAVLTGWGNLFADVPADDAAGDLNDRHAGLTAAIEGREDHLEDLSRAIDVAPSATLARAIAKLEAELGTLRDELAEIEECRRRADAGLIRARLDDLQTLLEPEAADNETPAQLDRAAVNAALKVLFRGVTVDYLTGSLRFHWRQGGEAGINYGWPNEKGD